MKFTIAAITLACAFAAEDTTPPVISLDLSSTYSTTRSSLITTSKTIKQCGEGVYANAAGSTKHACQSVNKGVHDTSAIATPMYDAAGNAQTRDYSMGTATTKKTPAASDYAKKCDVCESSGSIVLDTDTTALATCQSNCESPTATAYDHHEGTGITVTSTCKQYVVSPIGKKPYKDAAACDTTSDNKLAAKYYNKRGEFVLSYDAKDSSDNEAETLVFAMVMVDHKAPAILFTGSSVSMTSGGEGLSAPATTSASASVEACLETSSTNNAADRCSVKGFQATTEDNYDGSSAFEFKLDSADYTASADTLAISTKGKTSVTAQFVAKDFADIFGHNNNDNQNTLTVTVTVTDNTLPRLVAVPLSEGAVATANACDTSSTIAGVTSLLACAQHAAEKYIPTFSGSDVLSGLSAAPCGGCVTTSGTTTCYAKGTTGSCDPIGFKEDGAVTLNENWECGRDIASDTAVLTSAVGGGHSELAHSNDKYATPAATGAYCVDDNDSAGTSGCDNCNNRATKTVTATAQVANTNAQFRTIAAHGTTYSIDYSCSDVATNAAHTVTRTITIVDTVAPTLSITTQELRQSFTADENNNYLTTAADTEQCHSCGDVESDGCKAATAAMVAAGCGASVGDIVPMKSNTECCTETLATVTLKQICKGVDGETNCVSTDHKTVYHSAGYTRDAESIEKLEVANYGFFCQDACVKSGDLNTKVTDDTTVGVRTQWYKCKGTGCCNNDVFTECADESATNCGDSVTGFQVLKVGTYALKYSCFDGVHTTTKCRTIENEDHAKPIIDIIGSDEMEYEASSTENYVDAGATCWDEVDGNISEDVEVSGDVVNLARVGVYMIMYDCTDSSGRKATQATRKVTVQDTHCPTCTIASGSRTITLEASFTYNDPFLGGSSDVTCTDELSTSFSACAAGSSDTTCITTKTVNAESPSTEIADSSTITQSTGTYYTTYIVTDDVGNSNEFQSAGKGKTTGGTTCDFENTAYDATYYTRTLIVKDTLKPVITLKTSAGATIKTGSIDGYAHDGTVPASSAAYQGTTEGAEHALGLMAEESQESVNGWVLGAIASAVSGLALLGYSLRKQAQPVATSVPV